MTIYFFLFVLGTVFGSFIHALVSRTHERKSIVWARSMCPQCKKLIRWYDNIPLVSFFLLRGKCRSCRAKISFDYPMVEFVGGLCLSFLGVFYSLAEVGAPPMFFRDAVILFLLMAIFLYDFHYGEILDRFSTIPAAMLFFASLGIGWQTPRSLGLGILTGAGFFLFQLIVSRGRWIGGGDVRLGAFMGVILGWPKILVALFLAYCLGAVVSIATIAAKKKKFSDATPFGTYLTVATAVTMFFGDAILGWYLSFLS